MYSILIVDDELITLKMLRDFVNWTELGIHTVYTAEDGLDALEKAIYYKPHIIISDIKMPHLNGIDFISKVVSALPHTQFIFLSGYTDKEYLISAIKLRAINYIEKPIDIEEITESVKNAIKECEKTISFNHPNIHFLKRELCNQLVHSSIEPALLDISLEKIGIDTKKNNRVTCILITLCKQPLNDIVSDQLLSTLDCNEAIYCNVEENNITIFYFNPFETSNKLIHSLQNTLSDSDGYLISIGHNVAISHYEQTYLQAKQSHQLCFLKGYHQIAYLTDIPNSTKVYTLPPTLHLIKAYILDNQMELLEHLLQDLIKKLKSSLHTDAYEVKKYFIDIAILLKQMADVRQYTAIQEHCNTAIQDITFAYTLDDIYLIILELIIEITHKINTFSNTTYIVNKIISIIESDYSNQDLSINTISEILKLTPAYICTLFKKSTGKTINTYITDVRINTSKQLLIDTNHKIYHIASLLGYNDGKYFSKVFEKTVGIKPKKYREMYSNENKKTII